MDYLALEFLDRTGTGSQFAVLPDDTTLTVTETSEIFASGDVWSWEFQLNVAANLHLFGTSGDLHGARLHEQLDKRRVRLWMGGLPYRLGYTRLGDEVDVDADGNVSVKFESGQKTFSERIDGVKAREVSVGDVEIGVALNRKRVVKFDNLLCKFHLEGFAPYGVYDIHVRPASTVELTQKVTGMVSTPYVQRWPKLVKSHGTVYDGEWTASTRDWTNVQTPYDASHPFCNINICYPLKVNDNGEEKEARGYTERLAHGQPTTDGGDNQTRYNNAPNFFLLHFFDRLFKDMNIYVEENQALDVEDLRRVFMLNYGCHYKEIEDIDDGTNKPIHLTPDALLSKYGQFYIPILYQEGNLYPLRDESSESYILKTEDAVGKVLLREAKITSNNTTLKEAGSIEGIVSSINTNKNDTDYELEVSLDKTADEKNHKAYSAYLAYATGDNYPNVEISEILEAAKSMFGMRFIFDADYRKVRIILLRNVFRSTEVQDIVCEVLNEDEKVENSIRGFRMTYDKGTEDTNFYYKGFADLFARESTTWKDTSDTHDYSQWDINAQYDYVKQQSSAFNKRCYVTPVNGNAYGTKVDEEEDVLYPTVVEMAGFMDAEDGDCSKPESDGHTVEEVKCGASPVIMNDINGRYASLFTGEMKAPSPPLQTYQAANRIGTLGRVTLSSINYVSPAQYNEVTQEWFTISGKLDIFIREGFAIRMEDNYAIGNGGTPFDEADPGLQFGIMRGSGSDAFIREYDDPDDDENDAWEVMPGSGAVSHPDTCDPYGNLCPYDVNYLGQSAANNSDGRFSLKLRAEKLNPFYNPNQEDSDTIIRTKTEAGQAMTTMFTTANTNLLTRPKVSNATMRSAGWNCPGDGYATVYSMSYGVMYSNGVVHEILWSPIKPNGSVLTKAQLETYVGLFNGLAANQLVGHDTEHLILDIDTTDQRAELLHELQAIYYAEEGETVAPVIIPSSNSRYLPITNPYLRQRGLIDQFYKEYSWFIRNAKVLRRPVRIELAQLMAIDKTKRVRVGDVMGFINKIQYTVGIKTGLGKVVLEILYV